MRISERQLKEIIKAELMKEGVSDTLGFFADKAKRAIFSKKETSLQFRSGSARVASEIINSQFAGKVKDKMDRIKSKGQDRNIKSTMEARDKNNQRVEINSIEDLTSPNVNSWNMIFATSRVSIHFSCYYGEPKTATGQAYRILYNQAELTDKKGNELPKESFNEKAINENDARSLIEKYFDKMSKYLTAQIEVEMPKKGFVPDPEEEKRKEREEKKSQSLGQSQKDYEKRVRDVESEPQSGFTQFDPEFKLPIPTNRR